MVNKLNLEVTRWPWRPKTPWAVNIPASVGRRRRRRLFATRQQAAEFAQDYMDAMLRGGADSALDTTTVSRALKDYQASKLAVASKAHAEKLRMYGYRIEEILGKLRVATLRVRDVERFLSKPSWGARTRWNALGYLSAFLAWCQRRELIERNPARLVAEETKKPEGRKEILSVAEMALLLRLTRRDRMLRAFVVLGGFAGLRSVECLRLHWSDIDVDEREVHVRPEVIKRTRGVRERYVTATTAFLRWLPEKGSGRVVPHTERAFQRRTERLRQRMQAVMKRAGLAGWQRWEEWPHNCLRHSFASYLLAKCQDAGYVAHQMGHTSPTMVHQSYARAVRQADAVKWWAL